MIREEEAEYPSGLTVTQLNTPDTAFVVAGDSWWPEFFIFGLALK